MQSLFKEVEKELPLICERETDIETWGKRWALLKTKVEKFTPTNTDRDAIALGDKGAFILAAVEGGAKASEASRVYRAVVAQQHT